MPVRKGLDLLFFWRYVLLAHKCPRKKKKSNGKTETDLCLRKKQALRSNKDITFILHQRIISNVLLAQLVTKNMHCLISRVSAVIHANLVDTATAGQCLTMRVFFGFLRIPEVHNIDPTSAASDLCLAYAENRTCVGHGFAFANAWTCDMSLKFTRAYVTPIETYSTVQKRCFA